jgi:outer membrane protein OmpA-like peptidoglycan-associated protein
MSTVEGRLRHASILGFAFFMVSFLATSPAQAQLKNQRHLLELGLFLGPDFLPTRHDLFDTDLPTHSAFNRVALEIGIRVGYLPLPYVGVEGEVSLFPTKANDQAALGYAARLHVIAQYAVWKGLTPFAVVGGGMLGVRSGEDAVGNDVDGAFHWGVGLKYYLHKWFALRMDFRHIVSDGLEGKVANHFSLLVGATVVLGWKSDSDTDSDGIVDSKDQCPKKPGSKPSGCPDTDGDGITDNQDKCPKVPAKTADGCPADTDKDGVSDEKDKCPNKAGPAPGGCPDTDGDGVTDDKDKCPKVPAKTADGCPADADKDGVFDEKDKCPSKAGPAPTGCPDGDGDGVPDKSDKCPKVPAKTPDGCPPDADGDGIPDGQDKCPKKPETKNGYQDKDGCPDKIPLIVRRFTGTMRGIKFASGSAKIKRRSFRTLRGAAKVLVRYVALRIRVEGHTDSRGKAAKNLDLSRRRAQAVKDYLARRGVNASRIEVKGYGESKPLVNNRSRRNRAKNRRIEFVILK